jgi:hypothetical protein
VSNLRRLCLDTNVYIIGIQEMDSPEAEILRAIGYYGQQDPKIRTSIVLSNELTALPLNPIGL